MTGRKKHSAEEIVRKLRQADELTAAGKTGEQVAAGAQHAAVVHHGHALDDRQRPRLGLILGAFDRTVQRTAAGLLSW